MSVPVVLCAWDWSVGCPFPWSAAPADCYNCPGSVYRPLYSEHFAVQTGKPLRSLPEAEVRYGVMTKEQIADLKRRAQAHANLLHPASLIHVPNEDLATLAAGVLPLIAEVERLETEAKGWAIPLNVDPVVTSTTAIPVDTLKKR